MCQHLFLLSDLGKTFYPALLPFSLTLSLPTGCCQPMFRLAFVLGIMVRQHARHGNWERRVKLGTGPLRCYLKYRKCFTKLSQQLHSHAADWADLAEWLPHNRRQVKFIFLTNNMNFKDPVSHFPTPPPPFPLPFPFALRLFVLQLARCQFHFSRLLLSLPTRKLKCYVRVCVCVPCVSVQHLHLYFVCVWAWQS